MPLTKETRSLLDMAYRVGAPRFHELSVAQARHSAQKLHFAFRPEAPAVASTAEVPIPRPDTSALLARLYRPFGSHVDDRLALVIPGVVRITGTRDEALALAQALALPPKR